MNAIQIIQLILQIAPAGIQLTETILALIQAMEKHFTSPTPATQTELVTALGNHLKGSK